MTSTNSIPSLSTLVELINFFSGEPESHFKVYDMGRRISEISMESFIEFEASKTPWPTPLLQSAWLAICFTNTSSDTNFWFLKFPLDEQGKLVLAARDEYIAQFIAQIDEKVNGNDESQDNATESPYGYKPSEEKLANVNAIYKSQQGLEASTYYQDVIDYLSQTDIQQIQNWQHLGYQGIADYCSRISQTPKLAKLLIKYLKNEDTDLPQTVLNSFSTCLEHHTLPKKLQKAWINRIDFNNLEQVITGLRIITLSPTPKTQRKFIKQCLQSVFKSNIEILAIISGRNWECLASPKLMLLFLEGVAINEEGQQSFIILLNDLMFVPSMRQHVMEQFRNPQRSDKLTQAIGLLYAQF